MEIRKRLSPPLNTAVDIVLLEVEVRYSAGIPPLGKDNSEVTWSSINEIIGDMTMVIPFDIIAGKA